MSETASRQDAPRLNLAFNPGVDFGNFLMSYSILYLYNVNYDQEFAAYQDGSIPRHRFFGFIDLEEKGHQMMHCPLPKIFQGKHYKPILWRFYQAFFALIHQHKIDCIVATYESSALPVLLLKRLRLLRAPIIVVNVSLLQPENLTKRKRLWKWLLVRAEVILSYCSAQLEWLEAEYQVKKKRLAFVPLCVDTDYFTDGGQNAEEPFLLAVGTNEGKDYKTLIQALPDHIKLVAITDDYNANVIAQSSGPGKKVEVLSNVPIKELKQYYEKSRFLVIPLHESKISSGQTVLLENMALGKVVVVTDVSSIHDYTEKDVTAITVPPHDVAALSETIKQVWDAPEHFQPIGTQASLVIRQKFCSPIFADRLVEIIDRIVAR